MNPLVGARTMLDTRAAPERLERIQAKRLRRLIRHASTIPFQRDRFAAAGVNPDEIRTAADLAGLPVTTRADIQPVSFTTSGSTGHPVQILALPGDQRINDILTLRACWRYGLRFGGRKLSVRSKAPRPPDRSLAARLHLFQREWLFGQEGPDAWVEHCRRFRPHSIMLFMSIMRQLAQHLLDHGITDVRPDFLVSIGELLDPETRALVQRAFRAPVYDMYGSWEGGMMAWECPQGGGYHINSDWVIMEILKDGQPVSPGEEGDVVITNLHSYGMPFIRYAQGDRAVLASEAPSCGCHLPLLKGLCGRTSDSLVRPDGTRMSGVALLTAITPTPGLLRYRLTQEADLSLRMEAVTEGDLPESVTDTLRESLSRLMGGPIQFQIERVDDSTFENGTKFHRITSHATTKGREAR
jgi:phenylacetate-CoA ligase